MTFGNGVKNVERGEVRGDRVGLSEVYLSPADIGCQPVEIAVRMLTLVTSAYDKLRSLKQANTGCRSLDRNYVGVRHSSMRDVKCV